ncbi:MAG: ABC transporter permease [Planctomycetota bacterium]|nr:MAG: ABC transporter permease [Planctomycetota bacterium]
MNNPILRRGLAWLATLFAVHAACFLLVRGVRGGPFDQERSLPPEVEASLRQQFHLDESLWRQYGRSLGQVLRGDFGPSMRYRDVEVGQILADSLPVSLALGGLALGVALAFGISGGLWAAFRRGFGFSLAFRFMTSLFLAVPNFVVAGVGILIFSFILGWLPPAGYGSLRHWILPSFALGLPFAAQIGRLSRNAALEVLESPDFRTARAKGLPPGPLLFRHVLPQVLIPVSAFLGPASAGLLTGSLVIEQVFALPGMGAHFVQAALNRDYTLSLAVTLIYTALLGACTFAADLLAKWLDPRVEAI